MRYAIIAGAVAGSVAASFLTLRHDWIVGSIGGSLIGAAIALALVFAGKLGARRD